MVFCEVNTILAYKMHPLSKVGWKIIGTIKTHKEFSLAMMSQELR